MNENAEIATQLASALTDETGSGQNVFATSPTLVTPALGTPSRTLSVAYGNAALVSAVELAKEIVSLKDRISTLEALITKLIK